jgi:simple sugar transport system ATP-binding protein
VQPTRGLDLGAINYIHQRIIQDAKNGTAVLLISYELDEILSISTRSAVIDSGKIVYDSPAYKTNRATIAKYLSHSTSVVDKKISKQTKTAMKSRKGGK